MSHSVIDLAFLGCGGITRTHSRTLARFRGESSASRAQLIKLGAVTAGEAMTAPAVTIRPNASINQAAEIMTTRGVNRLPVVDGGRLVGIVTRADLVRAFARSDEQLATTIRNDVLLRVLWLDPSKFTVRVDDGVASITGDVERRSTAELVRETVAMVPGIVDVETRLSWSFDDSEVQPPVRDMVFPRGLR